MKTKKLFAVVLTTVCLMIGCASNPMVAVYDNDAKIASNTNTYNLINYEQSLEDGHFIANVEKMESMDTIWVFDVKEDMTLDIIYTLNVSSGSAKIVLINPDGEVEVIAECDSEMTELVQSTLDVKSGNNRIKIVANQNTKFDADIMIPEGEFKELG